MRSSIALFCLAHVVLLSGSLAAADGDLDPTFWSDGKIYLSGTGSYEVSAVAVAPDEWVVVVGTRDPGDGASEWFWRALGDTTAGSTCYFFPPGGASQGRAYAAAFDPAGRLIVAGSARYGSDRLAVARFSFPDCTLDTSFDGDGYWTLDIPGGLESVLAIAIDPIGWIALGGYQNNGTDTDMVVALLSFSGALIGSFSGNGWLTLDPSAAQIDDSVAGVAFDASHRVIAAGSTYYGTNGTNGDWIVARFTLTGALDPTFDGDGLARIAFDLGGTSARHDMLFGLALDPNSDDLLLCGSAQSAAATELAIARLSPNGVLDATFALDGKAHHALGGVRIRLTEIGVDGLGRVLAAGYREPSAGNTDLLAVRYTASGSLDGTFSGNGWTIVPFDVGPTAYIDDYGQAMTLQAGRMVLAGEVLINTDSVYRPGLARLDISLILADGFESGGASQWSAALGFPQQ
ncbi:MAG: hypothetical protein ABIV06_11695 [Thermoanaerobaculia bacterium]